MRAGIRTLATIEGTLAADAFDSLTDATCRNDTDSIPVAYTAALAAVSDDARRTTSSTVQHALLGELRSEYAHAADHNYAAVADAFDGLADTLAGAARVVDLRTAAIDVLHGTEEERAAWIIAEEVARRLDEHDALLVLAAESGGKQLAHESHRRDSETEQWLQRTVDASGRDPHRLWEAWDAPVENVAGRWGGMLLAGLTLRTTPLTDVGPYGRSLPADSDTPADEAVRRGRISWQRALALLALGCLALGVALGCGVFAAGFFVAALIEPRDVLLAAREALYGTLLLGAGVSSCLTWALIAAVGSEVGADAVVLHPREPIRHVRGGASTVVHG